MRESILEASKLVQNVLMASPNGVLILQPIFSVGGAQLDLFLTAVNSVARLELDCPANEVLGQSLGSFFPHLAGKESLETYWQVISTGKPARFDASGFRSGESIRSYFEISAVPLQHNLLITYTEITPAEPELYAEPWTNLLQEAFDESVSGLSLFEVLLDEQGQPSDFLLVRINKAGERMSGSTHEGLVGKTLWEMYPATKINGLFDQYVRVWQTGEVYATEHYYPEYDIWRDVKIVRVDRGVLVTYNDITALKKKEEEASRQAQLLDNVLQGVPIGMAVLSPVWLETPASSFPLDCRFVRINSIVEKILNLPSTHIVNGLISQLFSDRNANALLNGCLHALREAQIPVVDIALPGAAQMHWYQVSVSAKEEQLIMSFTDVTSLKQMYQEKVGAGYNE